MTKDQLKQEHNAPKREDFLSDEEYLNSKQDWVDNNPLIYAQILEAPH